jgi:hypothetical protein
MLGSLVAGAALELSGAFAAFMVGLAALVTAAGGVVVGLRNTHKLSNNAHQVEEVHALVNSQLSAQIQRAEAAEARIAELETLRDEAIVRNHLKKEQEDL